MKPSKAPAGSPKAAMPTVTSADAPAFSVRLCVETVTAGSLPEVASTSAVRLPGGTGPVSASRPLTKIVKVSLAVLTLETVSLRDACTSTPPTPKASDVGATAPLARRAALMSSIPAPACCTRAGTPGCRKAGAAVFTSRDRYCATVSPGRASFNSAAQPATIGDEKLVPSTTLYPLGSYRSPFESNFCAAVYTYMPTATMSGLMDPSTLGPLALKSASLSGSTENDCRLKSSVAVSALCAAK